MFVSACLLTRQSDLELGALVAFLSAYEKVYDPWKELIQFYQAYQTASVTYSRTMEYFDVEPEYALVPEGRQVFPELTARDNVMLGAFRRGSEVSAADIDAASTTFVRPSNAAWTSGAASPIATTARTRSTAEPAIGARSTPFRLPPAISTSESNAPIAVAAAWGVVAFESLYQATPSRSC